MFGKTSILALALASLLTLASAQAQSTNAPPRNVDDIFALLDQYTVDPA